MCTVKKMRSVIIYISPNSRTLMSKIRSLIADTYETGTETGYIFDSGVQVAHWLHYEGKLDKIPGNPDIVITPTFDCDEVYYADVIRNYNSYDIPKWFVAKSEDSREYLREEDFQVWQDNYNRKGSVVQKRSGKPFKSGLFTATVKTCERNPYTGLWGFTFEEDESIEDIKQLKIVGS